jgi:hypothetical protein
MILVRISQIIAALDRFKWNISKAVHFFLRHYIAIVLRYIYPFYVTTWNITASLQLICGLSAVTTDT